MLNVVTTLSLALAATVGEEVHPRYAAWFDADAAYDATAAFVPFAGYAPLAAYEPHAAFDEDAAFEPGAAFEPMALLVRADLVAKAAADDHGVPVPADVRTVLRGVAAWFDAIEETDDPIVVREPAPTDEGDEDGEVAPPASRAASLEQAAADHLRARYEALAEAVERRDGGDAKGALAAERRAARHATLAGRELTKLESLLTRDPDPVRASRAYALACIEEDLDAAHAALDGAPRPPSAST